MLIFQRYVLRELIGPIAISIIFFTLMMLLGQLFEMAEILLEAKIGWRLVLEILGILTVSLLIVTVPMAALLGVLIGTSRLTTENEILAMRVSGTSLFRVFYPVIILSFLGAGVLLYLGSFQIPKLYGKLLSRQSEIEFDILSNLEPGKNHDSFSPEGTSLYLYYDKRAPALPGDPPYTLRMENVAMRVEGSFSETEKQLLDWSWEKIDEGLFRRPGNQETLFFAEKGMLQGNIDDYSFKMVLENGTIMPLARMYYLRDVAKDTDVPMGRDSLYKETSIHFGTMVKLIKPEESDDQGAHKSDPRAYTIKQLWEAIQVEPDAPFYRDERRGRVHDEWKKYTALVNEFYSRLSLPFALPAFILIAIPLALQLRPQAKSVSFLLAILLIIAYYVMITWGSALVASNSSMAAPVFVLPNVLIGGIGLILFWKVEYR